MPGSLIYMTTVVHCKKAPYDIYIGRPSKWGNPFSHKNGTLARFKVDTREQAILAYREYLRTSPLLYDLMELDNKVLGCWCKPLSCHGDILVEAINTMPKLPKIFQNNNVSQT